MRVNTLPAGAGRLYMSKGRPQHDYQHTLISNSPISRRYVFLTAHAPPYANRPELDLCARKTYLGKEWFSEAAKEINYFKDLFKVLDCMQ